MRRLSAQERALWARVAASVKPLAGRAMPVADGAITVAIPVQQPPTRAIPPKPAAKPAPNSQSHPFGATLDGTWDRRITRGRIVPDRAIDLHGSTVAQAHGQLMAAIHAGDGARVLLVITGKGRPDRPSRIRAELMHWLERPDMRSAIASVRPAHPRHGGGGAFYVILRRPA
jgi:DNA-nicking Smr family endonuclease